MDSGKVILQHKRLCDLIARRRIKQSLDILKDMVDHASSGNLKDEYEYCYHIQEYA